MSTKLKEILTKNGPYLTPLNPISSQAKADPGLATAMFNTSIFETDKSIRVDQGNPWGFIKEMHQLYIIWYFNKNLLGVFIKLI